MKRICAIAWLSIFIIPLAQLSASENRPPIGTLDVVTDFIVEGWSLDPDVPSQSIDVHFYVDGPYPQGTFAGSLTTDILREDVNKALGVTGLHGFRWFVPQRFRDGQPHTLYAYGIDPLVPGVKGLLNGSPKVFSVIPPPSIQSIGQPYNIGAWYFTGWSSANEFHTANAERVYGRRDWWGGVRDHALGADPWGLKMDYSNREPLLGFYNLLEQDVMDAHIRQAASRGLSFFAFYWYWNTDKNREDGTSTPLRMFISSSLKQYLKFLIAPIKIGKAPMTLSMWKNSVVPFMVDNYISDPSYLKTVDGRPIVILFDLGFTNVPDMVNAVDFLRDYVIKRTGKNPVLLWLYWAQSVDDLVWGKLHLKIDGYACFQLTPSAPAEAYTQTLSRWTSYISKLQGFFHIPCASTGFDSRPWYKVGWNSRGVNEREYNTDITLPAFADHLRTVKDYLDTHPIETSKTLIVYAWNEQGETVGLEPNRVQGYQYLDTVKNVFGLSTVIISGVGCACRVSPSDGNHRDDSYVPHFFHSLMY